MTKEKNKLTPAALICILLCARSFSTLTFFPADTGGAAYLIALTISTLLQGLLLIPAVKLISLTKSSPLTLAADRSGNFGKAVTLAFLLYFIYEAFYDIGSLTYFTDYFFSVNMPRSVVLICLTLTAVLAARLDISVIGRTAQLAFFGVVVMLAVIAAGAAEDMDITRFDLALPDPAGTVGRAVLSETDRCECLVLFTFLAGQTNGVPAVTARRFLTAKAVVIAVIFGLVTAVTGSFALDSKLPVFTLAASSENLITERSDAIFLLVWVFTGLVKLSNLLYCAAVCIRQLRPQTSELGSALAAAAVPAAAAAPLLAGYGWENVVYSEHSLTPIILLAFVVPCILLHFASAKEHSRSNGKLGAEV